MAPEKTSPPPSAPNARDWTGKDPASFRPDEIRQILQNCQAYQAELEIQNEELRRVQEDLRFSRDKYSELYDFAPMALVTLNKNGSIVETNVTTCNLFETERESLLSVPFPYQVYRWDQSQWFGWFKDSMTGKLMVPCAIRLYRGKGQWFHSRISGRLVRDNQGQPCQLRLAIEDVSDQQEAEQILKEQQQRLEKTVQRRTQDLKRANAELADEITRRNRVEESLAKVENRYRTLVDNLPQNVFLKDRDGIYLSCNTAFSLLLGKPINEIVGKGDCVFFPEEIAAKYQRDDAEVLRSEKQLRLEETFVNAEGTFTVETVKAPVRDSTGEIMGVLGIFWDITERKQYEEDLRRHAQRLSRAQGVAHLGDWEWDREKNSLVWSHETYRIFGYEPGEVEPDYAFYLAHLHPEDRDRERETFAQWQEGKAENVFECRIIQKSGALRHVRMQWNSLANDADSRPVRLMGTVQDITERVEAKTELERYAYRMRVMHLTGQAILKVWSSEEVARIVLENLDKLIPCEHSSVTIFTQNMKKSRVIAARGPKNSFQLDLPEFDTDFLPLDIFRQGQLFYNPVLTREAARQNPIHESLYAEGIRSFVNVPLMAENAVLGLLNVGGGEEKAFQEADLEIARDMANLLALSIHQNNLVKQIREDGETKAALLSEVNHRVKNNLTAIIGLLYVERKHADPEKYPLVHEILTDLVGRVRGLATTHSLLSALEWNPLPLADLCREIVQATQRGLPAGKTIHFSMEAQTILVSPSEAHNLALVINELCTNVVKHGLVERAEVRIAVDIRREEDRVRLIFRDDGPGYPESFLQSAAKEGSVGMELLVNIVQHSLNGEFNLYNESGAVADIVFLLSQVLLKGDERRVFLQ